MKLGNIRHFPYIHSISSFLKKRKYFFVVALALIVAYQNCSKSSDNTVSDQLARKSGGSGSGFDGKIYLHRGMCDGNSYGVDSALKINEDTKQSAWIVKNCEDIQDNPIEIPYEQVSVLTTNGIKDVALITELNMLFDYSLNQTIKPPPNQKITTRYLKGIARYHSKNFPLRLKMGTYEAASQILVADVDKNITSVFIALLNSQESDKEKFLQQNGLSMALILPIARDALGPDDDYVQAYNRKEVSDFELVIAYLAKVLVERYNLKLSMGRPTYPCAKDEFDNCKLDYNGDVVYNQEIETYEGFLTTEVPGEEHHVKLIGLKATANTKTHEGTLRVEVFGENLKKIPFWPSEITSSTVEYPVEAWTGNLGNNTPGGLIDSIHAFIDPDDPNKTEYYAFRTGRSCNDECEHAYPDQYETVNGTSRPVIGVCDIEATAQISDLAVTTSGKKCEDLLKKFKLGQGDINAVAPTYAPGCAVDSDTRRYFNPIDSKATLGDSCSAATPGYARLCACKRGQY